MSLNELLISASIFTVFTIVSCIFTQPGLLGRTLFQCQIIFSWILSQKLEGLKKEIWNIFNQEYLFENDNYKIDDFVQDYSNSIALNHQNMGMFI